MCRVSDYALICSEDRPNPQAFLKHIFAPVVTFTFFWFSKVSQSLPPVHLHFHHFSHKEQTQQIKWTHQVTFAVKQINCQTEKPERSRDAENKWKHLALPDFGTPIGNVRGSFDFLCLLPSPCPGQALLISVEWEVGFGWGVASWLLLRQTNTYHSLHSPPLFLHCPGVLTTMARQPHMAQRSPPCPCDFLVSHCTVAWFPRYHKQWPWKWFCARTVTLGQQPWDCYLGTKNIVKATRCQNKLRKHIQKKAAF